MSADFRTEHFKGYSHGEYIHVVAVSPPGDTWGGENPLGGFTLPEIGELVEMAGQAWPSRPGVQVMFVVEARKPNGKDTSWKPVWSALAGIDGVDEGYATAVLEGMRAQPGLLEWRLVQRTTVMHDEILQPEQ